MLTETNFTAAAKTILCEPAAIKAVTEIESGGSGYLQDGRLRILFEGHQFYANLKRRNYDVAKLAQNHTYSNILYPHWDKTKYKGGAAEWGRLLLAATIDKAAAYESASYGLFQIMGFNSKLCQFNDVFSFVDFMKASEFNQLICFLRFVQARGLADALTKKDWTTFARGYNGSGQVDYYANKIKAAYDKFSNETKTGNEPGA